ncbi:hypothetical protein AK812_SmicGene16855 [Symbiodinium microadriaticum]|uniref:Uncharacterized protein n=1 Tax=Symbiodinium microadriaticum TaxID=2951 RepID=A0A1Q9DZA6_SYMMI|nr:hypothetical protein AK812_SmicGene16855 [Symbiodinium microadriaticum]
MGKSEPATEIMEVLLDSRADLEIKDDLGTGAGLVVQGGSDARMSEQQRGKINAYPEALLCRDSGPGIMTKLDQQIGRCDLFFLGYFNDGARLLIEHRADVHVQACGPSEKQRTFEVLL